MNSDKLKDAVNDFLNKQVVDSGRRALIRACGREAAWEQTPAATVPPENARMLAGLQRMAGNEHSAAVLDKTYLQGEKDAALEFVEYIFAQYELWAVTQRPDLLKTCRELINEALPPEERL